MHYAGAVIQSTALRTTAIACALLTLSTAAIAEEHVVIPRTLPRSAAAWAELEIGGIRGVTIGPIENTRHPGVGYGTRASDETMNECVDMGATWVSLTPFGRVADLKPTGIDLTFEAPFEENRRAVLRAIDQAHGHGLSVFLVPHLWVESGEWRALIDPGDDAAWARWAEAYRAFVLAWAEVARDGKVEMLSIGVELRSWATTARASSLLAIIEDVRRVYPGLLTYSANWDDADKTVIWSALDVIGVNAFYPLADHEGAGPAALLAGAKVVAASLDELAEKHDKPVVLAEFGYKTIPNPAIKPWEWPDGMKGVRADERAQAEAYKALLTPIIESRNIAGLFMWRVYADPDDVSQEQEWGFSPRGKQAELVLRDAFTAYWAVDGRPLVGEMLGRHRARTPGVYGWEMDPSALEPSSLLLP